MIDIRKRTVRDGYDRIADAYAAWGERVIGDPRDRFLAQFTAYLSIGARVVDLGCGAGLPSAAALARAFEVTGVDISAEQIRRARENVPQAHFVVGDLTEVRFERGLFDGATAFYSIAHVPREQHARLFRSVASWLRPGGIFLASLGAHDIPDWTGDWLGTAMFFSSFAAETNRRLLADAGFDLVVDEVVTMREPDRDVAFQWVLAKTTVP
jgi:SAM-dependent methyltransferase